MSSNSTPFTINQSAYAGFGPRLGSILLDFLILLPLYFITLYLIGLSKSAYYFTIIPSLIFQFWYSVYLVKRFGGTPGKLIFRIKILKLDGTKIGWEEAILRESIQYLFTICYIIITSIALSKADTNYYEGLNWREKHHYLKSLAPFVFIFFTWASNIWSYGELLVLLFNEQRRALHDFIAGTIVVKIKYIHIIQVPIA